MQQFHGTTILCVRRDGVVAMAGDGQVTMGETIFKGNARKVRRLAGGDVLAGFAGGTADAFTLTEKFEAELQRASGNLTRSEERRVGKESRSRGAPDRRRGKLMGKRREVS